MTFTITKPGIYDEEWRAVVGYTGYEVSNFGRVRSLDRVIPYFHPINGDIHRHHHGTMLRPGTMKSGHLLVVLGKGNNALVHHLVLEAFVGPAPEGMECRHWDGDPANNHADNLIWGTRAENVADMLRHGTHRWQKWHNGRRAA